MTARGEYTAGLRALADLLDANADAQLPQSGQDYAPLTWVTSWEADAKAETRAIIRAVGGKWDKQEAGTDGSIMKFTGRVAGLYLEILCAREQICRRVVTGTREVTETVPAPDAPTVEITKTVEDIEWICEPLLTEATS